MYPLIINKVFNEPWLIDTNTHCAIQQALINHIRGGQAKLFDGEEKTNESKPYQIVGQTAIINMFGVIGKHLSGLEMMCGGLSLDKSTALINTAINDSAVENILLHFNSPGGTVTGVYEAGRFISEASQYKPIYAYTETQMCSAAYWLASKCSSIITTPSASIGSIGVYMALMDYSGKMEKDGVKLNLIKSGEFKAMGIKPLTEAEQGILQARVEDIHEQFKTEVNEKRNVSVEYMEGLTYTGKESINNDLADALVFSLSEALEIINS